MRDDVYVSRNNGLLIFALVKANSKSMAIKKAGQLAKAPEEAEQTSFPDAPEADSNYTNDSSGLHRDSVSTPDFIDTTPKKKK